MIRIGFIRVFFFQFSGIFTMLFYSTQVFTQIGTEVMLSRGLTVMVGFILLVANFLFIPVAKCFNRKTIFVVGDVLLALMMVGAAVLKTQTTEIVGPSILILVFVLVFGSTVGSVTWMYLAEILNPQILVVVSMYSWVLQVFITLIFPIVVAVWDVSVMLYAFAVINALGALYSACDMVETKGKLKEEVLKGLGSVEQKGRIKKSQSEVELVEEETNRNLN